MALGMTQTEAAVLMRTFDLLGRHVRWGRPVSVSRELTKKPEPAWRGARAEAVQHFTVIEPRGELVGCRRSSSRVGVAHPTRGRT